MAFAIVLFEMLKSILSIFMVSESIHRASDVMGRIFTIGPSRFINRFISVEKLLTSSSNVSSVLVHTAHLTHHTVLPPLDMRSPVPEDKALAAYVAFEDYLPAWKPPVQPEPMFATLFFYIVCVIMALMAAWILLTSDWDDLNPHPLSSPPPPSETLESLSSILTQNFNLDLLLQDRDVAIAEAATLRDALKETDGHLDKARAELGIAQSEVSDLLSALSASREHCEESLKAWDEKEAELQEANSKADSLEKDAAVAKKLAVDQDDQMFLLRVRVDANINMRKDFEARMVNVECLHGKTLREAKIHFESRVDHLTKKLLDEKGIVQTKSDDLNLVKAELKKKTREVETHKVALNDERSRLKAIRQNWDAKVAEITTHKTQRLVEANTQQSKQLLQLELLQTKQILELESLKAKRLLDKDKLKVQEEKIALDKNSLSVAEASQETLRDIIESQRRKIERQLANATDFTVRLSACATEKWELQKQIKSVQYENVVATGKAEKSADALIAANEKLVETQQWPLQIAALELELEVAKLKVTKSATASDAKSIQLERLSEQVITQQTSLDLVTSDAANLAEKLLVATAEIEKLSDAKQLCEQILELQKGLELAKSEALSTATAKAAQIEQLAEELLTTQIELELVKTSAASTANALNESAMALTESQIKVAGAEHLSADLSSSQVELGLLKTETAQTVATLQATIAKQEKQGKQAAAKVVAMQAETAQTIAILQATITEQEKQTAAKEVALKTALLNKGKIKAELNRLKTTHAELEAAQATQAAQAAQPTELAAVKAQLAEELEKAKSQAALLATTEAHRVHAEAHVRYLQGEGEKFVASENALKAATAKDAQVKLDGQVALLARATLEKVQLDTRMNILQSELNRATLKAENATNENVYFAKLASRHSAKPANTPPTDDIEMSEPSDLDDLLKSKEEQLRYQVRLIDTITSDKDFLRQLNAKLEEQLKTATSRATEAVKAEADKTQLNQQLVSVRGELELAKSEGTRLTGELKLATDELKLVTDVLKPTKAEVTRLSGEVDCANAYVRERKKEYDDLLKAYADLKDQLEAAKSRPSVASDNADKGLEDQEHELLRSEMELYKAKANRLSKDMDRATATLEKWDLAGAKWEKANKDLKARLAECEKFNAEYDKSYGELKGEFAAAEKANGEYETAFADLKGQLAAAEKANGEYKTAFGESKGQLEPANSPAAAVSDNADKGQVNQELVSLRAELQHSKSEATRLAGEVNRATVILAEREKANGELKGQLELANSATVVTSENADKRQVDQDELVSLRAKLARATIVFADMERLNAELKGQLELANSAAVVTSENVDKRQVDQDELNSLRAELASSTTVFANMERLNAELKGQLELANSQAAVVSSENADKGQADQDELVSLRAELARATVAFADMQRLNGELKGQLELANSQAAVVSSENADKGQADQKELFSLRAELVRATVAFADMQRLNAELKGQLELANSQAAVVTSENADKGQADQDELVSLRTELKSANVFFAELQRLNGELKGELELANSRAAMVSSATADKASSDQEIASLRNQLQGAQAVKKAHDQLKQQLMQAKSEVANLGWREKDAQAQSRKANEDMAEKNMDIAQLQIQLSQEQEKFSKLQLASNNDAEIKILKENFEQEFAAKFGRAKKTCEDSLIQAIAKARVQIGKDSADDLRGQLQKFRSSAEELFKSRLANARLEGKEERDELEKERDDTYAKLRKVMTENELLSGDLKEATDKLDVSLAASRNSGAAGENHRLRIILSRQERDLEKRNEQVETLTTKLVAAEKEGWGWCQKLATLQVKLDDQGKRVHNEADFQGNLIESGEGNDDEWESERSDEALIDPRLRTPRVKKKKAAKKTEKKKAEQPLSAERAGKALRDADYQSLPTDFNFMSQNAGRGGVVFGNEGAIGWSQDAIVGGQGATSFSTQGGIAVSLSAMIKPGPENQERWGPTGGWVPTEVPTFGNEGEGAMVLSQGAMVGSQVAMDGSGGAVLVNQGGWVATGGPAFGNEGGVS